MITGWWFQVLNVLLYTYTYLYIEYHRLTSMYLDVLSVIGPFLVSSHSYYFSTDPNIS